MITITLRASLAAALLLLTLSAPAEARQDRPEDRPAPAPRPAEGRGWLGVSLSWETMAGGQEPVLTIRQVAQGSPAERGGLIAGDRVIRFGDASATRPERIEARASRIRPGETLILEVRRPGEQQVRRIRLEATEAPTFVAVMPRGGWPQLGFDTGRVAVRMNLDSLRREVGELQRLYGAEFLDEIRRFQDEVSLPGMLRTGQRVVAGAELAPLNPELGRYFGTDQGVLAVDVVDDTPAARGGLRAGDVLVRVDGEEVVSVQEVRAALERGYRNPPVAITVIRQGREVELRFPR
jgi:S1-C subfamily serine protease